MSTLTPFDQLPHITCRIEARSKQHVSKGTGFFFSIPVTETAVYMYVITNKHVLTNADEVSFSVSIKGEGERPDYGRYEILSVPDIAGSVVGHPDDTVDLAAFPVAQQLTQLMGSGRTPYLRSISFDALPDDNVIQTLTAVEDIIMVGYPTGIWDSAHNIPIIRRGITATPYFLDYERRPEFMIDAACFPGSSGSPVLLVNSGSYGDKAGGLVLGTRLYLLGVLWGGPQFNADGEIIPKPVPTGFEFISRSKIPINLGICVKARAVRELMLEALRKERTFM